MTLATNAPPNADERRDHRGSWVPTWSMITSRIMELRRRRGLMVMLLTINVGIPTLFLVIRVLMHAFAPNSYGPAGGYDIYSHLVGNVMFIFGFIAAATIGCTAGSIDLSEGMFRHLVITGRSRLSLYLARIPAGLALVLPVVAAGFFVVCTICTVAAPRQLDFNGMSVPAGLSRPALTQWAEDHAKAVVCHFGFDTRVSFSVTCPFGPHGRGVQIGGGFVKGEGSAVRAPQATPAQLRTLAATIVHQAYPSYRTQFLVPSTTLMIESGLWLLLESTIGFVIGLGLASWLGQRTIAVVSMIIFEIILTPILAEAKIPHLLNFQRAMVGLATAHLEPSALIPVFGGGSSSGGTVVSQLVPESRTLAVVVIVAWLLGWSIIGARRMMTRDA